VSRMGAEGYSSAGDTQLSARVPEELKEEFKAACEAVGETMTDMIEKKMAEVVEEHGDGVSGEGEYYPDDPYERELYEACLKFATDDLKIYQQKHARRIARETQDTSVDDLAVSLDNLRKAGFIALGPMPVYMAGEAAKKWRHWHVKPPCADPDHWKYREDR